MKKVTSIVASAFLDGDVKKMGNTATDGDSLYLFNNEIARKVYTDPEKSEWWLEVSLAGWNTVTTRDRINGMLELFGTGDRVSTRKGQALFNSKPVDESIWIRIHGC